MPIKLYHITVRAWKGEHMDIYFTMTEAVSEDGAWLYALAVCMMKYPDGTGWERRQYCVDSEDWRSV